MKQLILCLFIPAFTVGMAGAQNVYSGENAQKREVPSFHGIHVGTGIELVISQGNAEEVAVSADKEEYRDKIVTRVENGILKIYYENKLSAPNKRKEKKNLKAWVSCKEIDELEATTGASVSIEGTLDASSLKMRANTGARLDGKIKATTLTVDQSTGSQISLSGDASVLTIEGSTGSKFKGEELRTNTCNAKVSTGAGISVTAEKELIVKASTGGYVRYKGNAPVKDINKGTGGTVSKI